MKGPFSLALAVVTLAGLVLAGCGDSHEVGSNSKTVASRSSWNTPSAKLGGATPAFAAADRRSFLEKIAWVKSTPQPHFPNDGDHEEAGDEDKDNGHDTGTGPGSIDPYVDYLPPANNRAYHDEDDEEALKWGHATSGRDLRDITALVKRYYAAATTRDGAKACSMLLPSFAKAVPVDYGKLGSAYLRGGKTCPSVMTRLFTELRRELTAPIEVTQVRTSGSTALAFLGSKTMRASDIALRRNGTRWTISQVLGGTLL